MNTNSFSANSWIAANCVGANHLHPETVDVVSNFTLMWNFFEGVACDNRANIRTFERLSEEIGQHGVQIEGLEEAVKFWTFRYWTGSEFRDRFDGLHFRANDRRDHVEAVLRGEKTDQTSKLLAVMILVYRLRNNLFHGIKTVDMLNDQAVNLDMACKTLAAVLEASGNYLVRRQTQPNKPLHPPVGRGASRRPVAG